MKSHRTNESTSWFFTKKNKIFVPFFFLANHHLHPPGSFNQQLGARCRFVRAGRYRPGCAIRSISHAMFFFSFFLYFSLLHGRERERENDYFVDFYTRQWSTHALKGFSTDWRAYVWIMSQHKPRQVKREQQRKRWRPLAPL